MVVAFTCSTVVHAPPSVVFDLAIDIDAHVASMAASRERAVGARRSGRLALGQEVTWRAWHFGIPWTMTSRITELDRPHRFTDDQVRGPFATFRHVHRFEPAEDGTRMVDEVAFTAPLGPLGRLAERLLLARRLRELIEERNRYLGAMAEAREV